MGSLLILSDLSYVERVMKYASAFFVVLALTGCARPPMAPDAAITSLRSADADTRRRAAEDLRRDDPDGVPTEAVPALITALASEPQPAVRGAILLTLGRSGASEAKGAIEGEIAIETDPQVKRQAKHALKEWTAQNDTSDHSWSYWVPFWQPASKSSRN